MQLSLRNKRKKLDIKYTMNTDKIFFFLNIQLNRNNKKKIEAKSLIEKELMLKRHMVVNDKIKKKIIFLLIIKF